MVNLGNVYQSEGKYTETEALFEQAQALRVRVFGKDSPWVAEVLNNRAGVSLSLDKFAEAERLHRQAISLREKALGPGPPNRCDGAQQSCGRIH